MEAFYYSLIVSISLILCHNGEAMMGPPPSYQPLIQAYDIADGQCSGITSRAPGVIKTAAAETCRQAFLTLDQAGKNVCHGWSEAKCRRLSGHARYECTVKMPRCWADFSPKPRTLLECADSDLLDFLNRKRSRRDDGAGSSGHARVSGSGYAGASGSGYAGAGGSGYAGAGGAGYTGAGGSGYTGEGSGYTVASGVGFTGVSGSGYDGASGSGYAGAGGAGYTGAGGSGYTGAGGSGRISPQHASLPPSLQNPPSQYYPSFDYPSSQENLSIGQGGGYPPYSSNPQYPIAPEYYTRGSSILDYSLPPTPREPRPADPDLLRDDDFGVADVPYGSPMSPPGPDSICVDDIPYGSPIFVDHDPAPADEEEEPPSTSPGRGGSSSSRRGKGKKGKSGDEGVEGGRYKCDRPGCTKAYDTKAKLRKHIRSHEVVDEGRTICSTCKEPFSTRSVMRRHQASTGHVQTPSPPRESKQFQCPYYQCNRSYARQNTLNEHLKSHKGKADCPYCHESYGKPGAMHEHVRKKHPDKPDPRNKHNRN